MAAFNKTCAIVDLDPTSKPLRYAGGSKHWILWPAYAYRILVPVPAPERLNLFQRSVLALCVAGIVDTEEIGYKLAVGSDLAAYIFNELVSMGLLDRRGAVSERARRLFEDEPDDNVETVVGYVFQDPFERKLWPRFHQGMLPLSDGEIGKFGGKIRWGSVGNPKEVSARVIWPPDGPAPISPACRDILRTYSLYIRARAAYKLSIGRGDSSEFMTQGYKTLNRHVDQVVLVDKEPEPVFLVTYIFGPEEAQQETRWYICDPFGLGPDRSFRKRIEKLAGTSDGKGVRSAIERVTNESFLVEEADLLELLKLQNQSAARVVEENTGICISDYPEVLRLLLQMEKSRIEAEKLKEASGSKWDILQRELRTVVRRAYEVLEESLSRLVRMFPANRIWRPLRGSLEDNGVLLASVALKLGFKDDRKLPCFKEFLFTGAGPVKGVVLYDNRELVALLATALLSANNSSDHPFRRCSTKFPEFIVFLNKLKSVRDSASHYTEASLDISSVCELCDKTYLSVRFLLPAVGVLQKIWGNNISMSEWSADLVFRLRAQAAHQVESKSLLGEFFRELPGLHDTFIEMEHMSIEIGLLKKAGASSEELAGLMKDFVIACSNGVEAAVKLLLTDSDVRKDIWDDRDKNAFSYAKYAQSLGFTALSGGGYPEGLLKVRPDRARVTAATRRGALNALLMVAVFQAHRDKHHPLREIVKIAPEFLLFAGEVSQRRGHGDGRGAEAKIDVELLRKYTVKIGQAVIKVAT